VTSSSIPVMGAASEFIGDDQVGLAVTAVRPEIGAQLSEGNRPALAINRVGKIQKLGTGDGNPYPQRVDVLNAEPARDCPFLEGRNPMMARSWQAREKI